MILTGFLFAIGAFIAYIILGIIGMIIENILDK